MGIFIVNEIRFECKGGCILYFDGSVSSLFKGSTVSAVISALQRPPNLSLQR